MVFNTHGEIVSLPYTKFFNYGENQETIQECRRDYDVNYAVEKLDGTLIHTFVYGGKVNFATRGVVNESEYCEKAKDYYDKIQLEHPNGLTLIWELLDPLSKVLIDYTGRNGLYLTGIYDLENTRYYNTNEVMSFAAEHNLLTPKIHHVNIDINGARTLVDNLDFNEGFVVVFEKDNEVVYRVKVKSTDYLNALKLQYNFSPDKPSDVIKILGVESLTDRNWDNPDSEFDKFLSNIVSLGIPEEIPLMYKESFNVAFRLAKERVDRYNEIKNWVENYTKYEKVFNRKKFASECIETWGPDSSLAFSLIDGKKICLSI